jgi:hypothetical protein
MISFLFNCLLWGLGVQTRAADNSSGFGSDQLTPIRERNGLEAAIRILSSVLFIWALLAQFLPEELGLLHDPRLHLLAFAGALWSSQALFRPGVPMDSTAIATALWSFAGYLPYFLIGNLLDAPVVTLLGQAGIVGSIVAIGLFRDIRREIRADKG